MNLSKEKLRERFSREWKKHYAVDFLIEKGFERKKCEKCGRFFWTLDSKRKTCADSSCVGFEFIGKGTKHYGYIETWRAIEKYFTKHGHKSIPRYPVVARWRDDLYFTNASIIDFQPYVVSGEIAPPANPLIVPQASLRFKDLENVGVTGQHFTAFIMFGQHAFNSPKTGLFYWKNEAVMHDFNYLTKVIGVKAEELAFQEDVWMGGGTFGPCIEYCAKGVELGNIVFMQFKELANGKAEELKTKVIDMGAGLERIAWYTNGTPTSYDVVFASVLPKMKDNAGLEVDDREFAEFAKCSGCLDVEEGNIKEKKNKIFNDLGINERVFSKQIRPLQALYAAADHLKAVLYAVSDGMLPSNAGGGYNLRLVLRRVFAFDKEFGLNLDYAEILAGHAEALKPLDATLLEGVDSAIEVVREEEKKYSITKKKCSQKVSALMEKTKKGEKITTKQLVQLYESDGVPVEMVEEEAKKLGVKIDIPENFYQLVAQKNEKAKPKALKAKAEKFKKTKQLFYEEKDIEEFSAKVLGVDGKAIILDRTLFYPDSGGQAPDHGTLNGIEVEDVEKFNGVIYHYVKKPSEFKKGTRVIGKIDLKRREQLKKHHTAAHLLNAAARSLLGKHVWQAGARKEENKAHLDITHYKRITSEELRELELLVNKSIQQNLPVHIQEMPRNEAEKKYGFILYQGGYVPGKILRIVNIKGVDVEACGGTHVKSTGEIGFFKILKRESVQDGIERIVFACGEPALRVMHQREELLEKAAKNLSVQAQELPHSTERFFHEWKELRKELEKARQKIAEAKSRELMEKKGKIIKEYIEGIDSKALMEIGNRVIEKRAGIVLVLGTKENVVVFCGSKSKKNAREELQKILAKAGGKGGGSERMAAGRVENSARLKELLEK